MKILSSIFSVIAIPFGWLLRTIYDFVGNYGLSLALFTLVTKLLLLPLSVKQKKSMIRMNAFQPMIQNIQKKYANDPAKQQEELSRLQTEHGFSMTSGCLPVLIQLPIMISLIKVIYNPLRYLAKISSDVIETITPIAKNIVGTLSHYSPQTGIIKAIKLQPGAFSEYLSKESIGYIEKIDMSFFGMDLSATPSIKVFDLMLLIPVLSVGLMVAQQIISQKLNGTKMEGPTKYMPVWSAVMFGYFSFVIPAGVSVYWIFSSFFGIIQELILKKFFDPEKEKEKIEAEIAEKKKKRREEERRARPKRKRAVAIGDKYKEETFATKEERERAAERLARARAIDKGKYGE
jgi:YidC/Oxa1 family membrane protein insertase